MKSYLFVIDGNESVATLRFDPFATYDEYADKGEMQVDAITVFQLPE
jgi:alpha-L-rhamnosidase